MPHNFSSPCGMLINESELSWKISYPKSCQRVAITLFDGSVFDVKVGTHVYCNA